MKHRLLPLVLVLGLLGVLASACGTAASTRGWAQPTTSGSTVLVSTSKAKLDGLDSSGTLKWRFPDNWTIQDKKAQKLQGIYAQPIVANDVVYVADYNGYVYAIKPSEWTGDAANKPKALSIHTGGAIVGGMALDSSTGTLFVTSSDGKVYAIDTAKFLQTQPSNTSPLAEAVFTTGDRIWSSPLLSAGNLFVASTDHNLYAWSPSSRSQQWSFGGGGALVTTPVLANGTVLVGGFDDKLHAVDASSGQQRWSFDAANWVWSRPWVEGNQVYLADFDGNVYGIDLSDGHTLWSGPFSTGSSIRSGPMVKSGVLVVATDSGDIYGLDPATGERKWGPVLAGASVHADVVADGNNVIVTTSGCSQLDVSAPTPTDPNKTVKKKVLYYRFDPASQPDPNAAAVLSDRGC